ncbi:MAG: hypothetical protein LBL34_06810 [Clostridiales bacterium]|nr:hypothetical protein [Clostridiales bacterium]
MVNKNGKKGKNGPNKKTQNKLFIEKQKHEKEKRANKSVDETVDDVIDLMAFMFAQNKGVIYTGQFNFRLNKDLGVEYTHVQGRSEKASYELALRELSKKMEAASEQLRAARENPDETPIDQPSNLPNESRSIKLYLDKAGEAPSISMEMFVEARNILTDVWKVDENVTLRNKLEEDLADAHGDMAEMAQVLRKKNGSVRNTNPNDKFDNKFKRR